MVLVATYLLLGLSDVLTAAGALTRRGLLLVAGDKNAPVSAEVSPFLWCRTNKGRRGLHDTPDLLNLAVVLVRGAAHLGLPPPLLDLGRGGE